MISTEKPIYTFADFQWIFSYFVFSYFIQQKSYTKIRKLNDLLEIVFSFFVRSCDNSRSDFFVFLFYFWAIINRSDG